MTGAVHQIARQLGAPPTESVEELAARIDAECFDLEARIPVTPAPRLREALATRLGALRKLRETLGHARKGEDTRGSESWATPAEEDPSDQYSPSQPREGASTTGNASSVLSARTTPGDGGSPSSSAEGARIPSATSASLEPEAYLWQSLCDGRFVVERFLGHGELGVVYAAAGTVKREEVVLVVQAPWFSHSASARQRLLREVEIAAHLRHENIVCAQNLYTDGPLVVLVMPRVDGETLRERLDGLQASGAQMSPEQILDVAVQCARALAYAHEKGWVHGTLNPESVLLLPSGMVKVRGLGSARDVARPSSSWSRTADLDSERTEVMERKDDVHSGFRGDHVGLGGVLHEALMGRVAGAGANPLGEPRPDVLRQMDVIVDRLLAPAPDVSASSMGEIVESLEACRHASWGRSGSHRFVPVWSAALVAFWLLAVALGGPLLPYEITWRGTEAYTGELILVPAGSFVMGSSGPDAGSAPSTETQVEVTLTRDFYMGRYPVTQAQYVAVMGYNPSHFGICGGDCPVETLSYRDATNFIDRLNDLLGYHRCYAGSWESPHGENLYDCEGFRLPTEAEWEYVARAGRTSERDGVTSAMAWHSGNSGGQPRPVGRRRANAWGFHDMFGNVWEWTSTAYSETLEGGEDPRNERGAWDRELVRRGGSWMDDAETATVTSREPGVRDDVTPGTTGVRLVRTARSGND